VRLTQRIYLVGGGELGFGMSSDPDCHIYAVETGTGLALVDAGTGLNIESILANLRFDGLDPERLRWLFLTHAHADHAGGAAAFRERFDVEVIASTEAAAYLRAGDEEKISLPVAKRGGVYPASYSFRACEVAHELCDGETYRAGEAEFRAYTTPGHCSGMLSFLIEDAGRKCLFSGDTVFHGGKILISNIWDCSLTEYAASLRKLAALNVDALLPGHLAIALSGGSRHIRRANDSMERFALPPNIL